MIDKVCVLDLDLDLEVITSRSSSNWTRSKTQTLLLYCQYSCGKLFSIFLIKTFFFLCIFHCFFKNSTLFLALFFVYFGLTESLEALQILLKYQILPILMHNMTFRQMLISLTISRTLCRISLFGGSNGYVAQKCTKIFLCVEGVQKTEKIENKIEKILKILFS